MAGFTLLFIEFSLRTAAAEVFTYGCLRTCICCELDDELLRLSLCALYVVDTVASFSSTRWRCVNSLCAVLSASANWQQCCQRATVVLIMSMGRTVVTVHTVAPWRSMPLGGEWRERKSEWTNRAISHSALCDCRACFRGVCYCVSVWQRVTLTFAERNRLSFSLSGNKPLSAN